MIYHQFDGGVENANKYFLAVAEWLVLKGLAKKVVLTRLPVGHTHEDIDAMFAHIWKALNSKYVLTPSLQKIHAIQGLGKKKQILWHDLWCIPDYEAFFFSSIGNITRAFKVGEDEWSQLQWTIESKGEGKISTTYRAYASEDVVELWDKKRWEEGKLPMEFRNTLTDLVPVQVCLIYISMCVSLKRPLLPCLPIKRPHYVCPEKVCNGYVIDVSPKRPRLLRPNKRSH